MKKSRLISGVLAALPMFFSMAHAAEPSMSIVSTPSLSGFTTDAAVTVTFTGLALAGFQFSDLTAALGPFNGSLTQVSVNATLDASVDYTYADDLTIYVDVAPLSTGGLLQVGGFSDLAALEGYSWANGGSSDPGTTVIDSYTLITPISFAGTAADPTIWLGNGYGATGTSGTWTGTVTLTFTSAVPEPSSWALMAAGGLAVVGGAMRRRRKASDVR